MVRVCEFETKPVPVGVARDFLPSNAAHTGVIARAGTKARSRAGEKYTGEMENLARLQFAARYGPPLGVLLI